MLGQVVHGAVPFFTHTRCMVSQQGHFGMYQNGFAMLAHPVHSIFHGSIGVCKVAAVHTYALHTLKPCGKLVCVHCTRFVAAHRDTPVIVLHKINYGQLVQYCKLECLTYLTLGNTAIAQRANGNRRHRIVRKFLFFTVLYTLGHTCGRYHLHSGSAALVYNAGKAFSAYVRMVIVCTATGKRIPAFCQQLQHQLVGAVTHTQHQAFIAIVGTYEVARLQQETCSQLYSLMAAGGTVYVFTYWPVGLINIRHCFGGHHQPVGFQQQFF